MHQRSRCANFLVFMINEKFFIMGDQKNMKVYTFKFMINGKIFITEMNNDLQRDSEKISQLLDLIKNLSLDYL